MKNNLLIILTRNPELGKCKTRLAAKVGDESALEIYKFLLEHTVSVTKDLNTTKWVFYSEKVEDNDMWDPTVYEKRVQVGQDLGERMMNAFKNGLDAGFAKIVIIGSDMYDLRQQDIEEAFESLAHHDFVVGPAVDGGYYLLGMKSLKPELFMNKSWGGDRVLSNTLKDMNGHMVHLLSEKNDVDFYEDIKDIEAFQPFLKHIKE
ncbi:DUF2064 domain-containing protein [Muricauda sp. JGD-17]|uniref:DUF2064 domain-containing protein n=1 Tax=Flagellimonas ochracea TaxID=2696472 RepID=A0A964TC08_9FLAO|nr:TIGR04282 family arsenosugar biosynthesis glycosyltransferase [Allomuricauda ochracea]NAY92104.1 DUF2064 domain-containing protein [Allomuricauda ochracea]